MCKKMAECGLLNLASCIPQKFFEYLVSILNTPIKPLIGFIYNILSEPINLQLFVSVWAIIIYTISMFYAFLLIYSGFNFMISGYDPEKREQAKVWLRNVVIMIILVQASFFMYELAIELSSVLTTATLSLIDNEFFLLTFNNLGDIGLSLIFLIVYLATLLLTSLILIIRYVFVAIGVVLFPVAIFLYFIPVLRQYGSLILNFLGVCIFVTFFDAIILIGFSKLLNVGIFANFKILVMVAAFLVINLIMAFLMLFSIVKGALSIYQKFKQ